MGQKIGVQGTSRLTRDSWQPNDAPLGWIRLRWIELNGCRPYFWQSIFKQEYTIKGMYIVLPNFVIAIWDQSEIIFDTCLPRALHAFCNLRCVTFPRNACYTAMAPTAVCVKQPCELQQCVVQSCTLQPCMGGQGSHAWRRDSHAWGQYSHARGQVGPAGFPMARGGGCRLDNHDFSIPVKVSRSLPACCASVLSHVSPRFLCDSLCAFLCLGDFLSVTGPQRRNYVSMRYAFSDLRCSIPLSL